MAEKDKRQCPLSIRLTESAVFLRSEGTAHRSHDSRDARPSLLRGLLVLDLAKPTRITSIELELIAKTSVSWPEGIGARRAEVNEEHVLHRASTVYFRAVNTRSRRGLSLGPGTTYESTGDDNLEDRGVPRYVPRDSAPDVQRHESIDISQGISRGRSIRRLSADSSFFHNSTPISHEDFSANPTPPYSPNIPSQPPTPLYSDVPATTSPNASDDYFTSALRNKRGRSTGFSFAGSILRSGSSSRSLSRRPSFEDVPETPSVPGTPRYASRPSSRPASRPASALPSRAPSPPPTPGSSRHSPNENIPSTASSRSRLSVSSVSNALLEAVRPNSISQRFEGNGDDEKTRRGRTKEKDESLRAGGKILTHSKERSAFSRIGDILRFDHEASEVKDGWKEFKSGTYTYPISFHIPANSPPTLRCQYGTVIWRLQATVHRPGTFTPKLAASREVLIISSPTEDGTEASENITVERHWENHLQYLISVSGRAFHIGGTIPISITLLPLAKVKVHRIAVLIEERVDYYTQMRRIARSDPLTVVELLNVKNGPGATPPYVLPLESDNADVLKNSPLSGLLSPDDDLSEVTSNLMGPGPWSFHRDLKLPTSCSYMHFTNKDRKSNIVVTHHLKCLIRAERSDDLHVDLKTGKRKLYDIVIQTPVNILSCRCSPDWSSLPRYSEALGDVSTIIPLCPCETRRGEAARTRSPSSALERMASRLSSDSNVSAGETSPINAFMASLRPDSLHQQNSQYERLISGQETEIGEVPPAYSPPASLSPVSSRSPAMA